MIIAVFYQGRKQDTSEVAHRLVPFLQKLGHDVRIIDTRREAEERPEQEVGRMPTGDCAGW